MYIFRFDSLEHCYPPLYFPSVWGLSCRTQQDLSYPWGESDKHRVSKIFPCRFTDRIAGSTTILLPQANLGSNLSWMSWMLHTPSASLSHLFSSPSVLLFSFSSLAFYNGAYLLLYLFLPHPLLPLISPSSSLPLSFFLVLSSFSLSLCKSLYHLTRHAYIDG